MNGNQGEVWWGPAPHKSSPAYRPWVIISDTRHPFSETECIALGMTTQRHSAGIEVPDGAWIRGGADAQSYISPWYVATLKYADLDRQQGALSTGIVTDAIEALHEYTPRPD